MAQKKTPKPKSHQKTPPKSAQVKNQKKAKSKMNWIVPVALVVVAAIIGAIVLLNNNSAASDRLPAEISVTNASQRFNEGAYLLDVRTVAEWNENHVDGAVLIPLDELSSRISEVPTDQDVLIICRSGNRSAQARDILRAAGLMRTTSIAGGINAWMSAGLPVVTGP